MENPLNVMRGLPTVTSGACQWWFHVVRFPLKISYEDTPDLITFTARLPRTCVNCARTSLEASVLAVVAAGWLLSAAENGSETFAALTFVISRVCGDSS